MFIDLKEHLEKNPDESTLLVAVRDYPFLKKKLKSSRITTKSRKVSWVQEEPKTKALGYLFILILKHLLLIDMILAIMVEFKGSTAEGDGEIHKLVQNRIIESSINN